MEEQKPERKQTVQLEELGHDLHLEHEDPLLRILHNIIHFSVKILAVLMVMIIVWGVGDVIYVLYTRLVQPPFLLLKISDILATFGAFLAVLIAIEIFLNITLYLSTDVVPVRIVIATALMAIARKVIILDFDQVTPPFIYSTALVILALGITYWLIMKRN
jgi:uncharacterized membrane protein (DUF373 family)